MCYCLVHLEPSSCSEAATYQLSKCSIYMFEINELTITFAALWRLDIKVVDIQGVRLDKFSSRFYLVTH